MEKSEGGRKIYSLNMIPTNGMGFFSLIGNALNIKQLIVHAIFHAVHTKNMNQTNGLVV